MLQQTQVKTVIPFWERWLRELPTIEAAANASSDKLHKLWEGLGYYTRVRNLQKAAQIIVAQHGGKFPERFDDVLALPGVGRYTAGAICSIAFNQPRPILDGNVIRVLTRIFGVAENPKEKNTNQRLWKLAEEMVVLAQKHPLSRSSRREEAPTVPEIRSSKSEIRKKSEAREPKDRMGTGFRPYFSSTGRNSFRNSEFEIRAVSGVESQSLLTSAATGTGDCSALNQSLMELGALVCTPRNAQCPICPLKGLCVAFREKRVEELPNLGQREKATARRFVAFVVERSGKFLVRQRPAGVVNGHLWEFPNVEIGARACDPQQLRPPGHVGIKREQLENSTLLRGRTSAWHSEPRSVTVAEAAKQVLGFAARDVAPLVTVKHSITRYRITMEAFKLNAGKGAFPKNGGVWKTPAQMQALAFTSAHGKVLRALS
jgi:adenine-specific DNA glycosylase